jgi:hypothetical protein
MPTIDFDDNDPGCPAQASEWAGARRLLAQQAPPWHVEDALMRAFKLRHAPLPWYRRLGADAIVSGFSLAGVGCIALLAATAALHSPAMAPAAPAMSTMYLLAQGFLPLADAREIRKATHAQLLQAELPRHVLLSLGVPLDEGTPDELLRTELMVTESGQPIAVRLAFN